MTAWMAAMVEASVTEPFGTSPLLIAAMVSARRNRLPLATALRATAGLAPMSTIARVA